MNINNLISGSRHVCDLLVHSHDYFYGFATIIKQIGRFI